GRERRPLGGMARAARVSQGRDQGRLSAPPIGRSCRRRSASCSGPVLVIRMLPNSAPWQTRPQDPLSQVIFTKSMSTPRRYGRTPHWPKGFCGRGWGSVGGVNAAGDFVRDTRYLDGRITADGRDGTLPAEAGRYRLVVARACPWANRTMIVRRLMGLEPALSMGICGPEHDWRSWSFDLDPEGLD